MSGSLGRSSSPSTMCRSVRHTPHAAISSSTCPAAGRGTGRLRASSGVRGALSTIARIPLASTSDRMPPAERFRIAVIPGDGIGQEVVPEGVRVLDAVAPGRLEYERFEWGCQYYLRTGRM